MRIQGRVLRPATLAERRILKSFGLDHVRVPRRFNPFAVARLLKRISFGGADMPKLQRMLKRPTPLPAPPPPCQHPDSRSTPDVPVEQDAA
jgi:hypothetical protein